jgi:hypothetical protein
MTKAVETASHFWGPCVVTGLKANVNETTKPLKRLPIAAELSTGLKPGVNEKASTPSSKLPFILLTPAFKPVIYARNRHKPF